MTGKALGGLRFRLPFLIEGEGAGPLAAALFHVCRQIRTMAGEADTGAAGTGDGPLGVARFHETGDLLSMAIFTRLAVSIGGLGTVDGHSRTEQGDHPRDQGKH